MAGPVKRSWSWGYGQLNWFRIHLLAFLLVPLMCVTGSRVRLGEDPDSR